MFSGLTVAAIVAEATVFATSINGVVLIVIGFGVVLTLANWAIAKFRSR